jgi:hypothetical protein
MSHTLGWVKMNHVLCLDGDIVTLVEMPNNESKIFYNVWIIVKTVGMTDVKPFSEECITKSSD